MIKEEPCSWVMGDITVLKSCRGFFFPWWKWREGRRWVFKRCLAALVGIQSSSTCASSSLDRTRKSLDNYPQILYWRDSHPHRLRRESARSAADWCARWLSWPVGKKAIVNTECVPHLCARPAALFPPPMARNFISHVETLFRPISRKFSLHLTWSADHALV